MSMTVKAYLESQDPPEIRRFCVDQGVSANFVYLNSKITQVFPSLRHGKYTLFWKDSDNDYISFSSDDELMEALGQVNDAIFRVYIRATNTRSEQPQKQQEPSNTGVRHPGVICDACDAGICGIRYKCNTCPDYDLCSPCEAKGIHTEHDMRKITEPNQFAPWLHNFMQHAAAQGPGMFPPPPPHGQPHGMPHGMPHCPPPPPPPYGEAYAEASASANAEGNPEGEGPGYGPGPWGRPAQWRRYMRQCWRRMWKDMYGDECPWKWAKDTQEENKKQKKAGKGKGKQQEGESQEKNDKDEEKMQQDEGSDDEADESPTEDYLKNVGSSVAAMLGPLGIDVEVDVEHKGQRRRCGGPGGPGGPGPWAWWGAWGPQGGRGGCGGRGGRGGRGRWGHQMGAWSNHQGGENTQNKQQETAESEKSSTSQQNPVPTDMETGEGPTTPPQPTDKEQTPEGDWTVLTPPSQSDTTSTHEPAQTSTSTAIPLPPSSQLPVSSTANSSGRIYPEVPSEPDDQIGQATEMMKAMGFSNDGGWLTRLLEVNNGDINKALDAIKANKQQFVRH